MGDMTLMEEIENGLYDDIISDAVNNTVAKEEIVMQQEYLNWIEQMVAKYGSVFDDDELESDDVNNQQLLQVFHNVLNHLYSDNDEENIPFSYNKKQYISVQSYCNDSVISGVKQYDMKKEFDGFEF